ncbi:MAG: iron ABC transporter permease [Candidatus Binatia bacterium]|jgi:iron(III) transport system permease protein|nr:iron ABC transporter permease [Candidatus Binatia bacterium]
MPSISRTFTSRDLWARSSWLRQRLGPNLFFDGIVLVLLWLVLIPLGQLLLNSFRTGHPAVPSPLTLKNYVVAAGSPLTYEMIWNTFVFAGAGTLLTVSIAILFAWLTERTDMPGRNLAWSLLLIPMAMPGFLFSIAWIFLLGSRIGLVTMWLRSFLSLMGIDLETGPLNIYSMAGMIYLDGLRGVTTVFLLIVGAFRAMDPNLEEAGRIADARGWTTFRRITLPTLLPAILAAFLYSFISSMESFEAPWLVGLPARIYVYSTMIYFSTRLMPSYGLAATFAVSYCLIAIVLVVAYQRIVLKQAERFATVTGKGYRPRVARLGRLRWPAFGLFVGYFFLAVILPLFILLWAALSPSYQQPSWEGLSKLTLVHFRHVFMEPDIWQSTLNTIVITITTATLTVLLSFFVSWIVVRTNLRGRFVLDGLTFLAHAIPGIIIALAFIFVYLQSPFRSMGLYGTVWIISLALITQYVTFTTRTTNAAITQVHKELEEVSRVSGVGRITTLTRVTLPLIPPPLLPPGSGWPPMRSAHSPYPLCSPARKTGRFR